GEVPGCIRTLMEGTGMPNAQYTPSRLASKPTASAGARIVRKRVASLIPSPENKKLYDRRDEDDEYIAEIAKSIQKNGVLHRLVVPADNYIVAGHCRHQALCRLGARMGDLRSPGETTVRLPPRRIPGAPPRVQPPAAQVGRRDYAGGIARLRPGLLQLRIV